MPDRPDLAELEEIARLGRSERHRHVRRAFDALPFLLAEARKVETLTKERDEAREGLKWIVNFAEKNVADGPLVGRHTGFVHIVRAARAFLGEPPLSDAALEGASDG